MSVEGGIGAFMQGLALGAKVRQDHDKPATSLAQPQQSAEDALNPGAGIGGSSGKSVSGGGTSPGSVSGAPIRSSDPVATDLLPHQRAFLNAISDGESAGKYNVRYTPAGGAEFSDLSRHPGIMEPTADGKKSSAAGRYQFTKTTWDSMGGGDFSPENQDRRAWQLAVKDYGDRTGRDLSADLQSGGLTPQVLKALAPTWSSFKSNGAHHIAAFNDSLARYGTSGPAPKSIVPQASSDAPKGGVIKIMSDLFPQERSISVPTA